mmetsp:Transcript_13684/g.36636  ORF Transcript_13684/g.36636 Transcript_13684/m.36636 type:complete len:536 (+) Transcript_13684:123-1730(+)
MSSPPVGGAEWTDTNETVRDLHRALITSEPSPEDGPGEATAGVGSSQSEPVLPTMEAPRIKEPGGFRRDFLRRRAEAEGEPVNVVWLGSLVEEMSTEGGMLNRLLSYSQFPYGYMFDDDGNRIRGAERQVKADATNSQIALAIFKAFVAEGIMFLPGAVRNAGSWMSVGVMLFVAWCSKEGIYLLLECHTVCPGTLGDIAQEAAGTPGRMAVEVSLVLSQFAICCAMLIFTLQASEAALMQEGMDSHTYRLRCVLLCLLVLVPLCWVRNLKKLAVSNLLANLFVVIGVGISVYYFVAQIAEAGVPDSVQPARPETLAIYLGTTCYIFEGIPLVLPIYESMANKQDFPRVFNWVFWVGVVMLETFYGLVGYLAFGDDINPVSILSIPMTSFTKTIMVVFSVAVVLSFPMMFVPATRIIESLVWTGNNADDASMLRMTHVPPEQVALRRKWGKNTMRMFLTALLCAVSLYGADMVSEFVALSGSICCVPLAFIYPAYFNLRMVAKTPAKKLGCVLLMTGGITLVPLTFYQVITNKSG